MELTKRSRLSTDARRAQLLSSGVGLLAPRPYDEVSIEEIAHAAGVSKGLLYHYFPTKQDFVLAALERGQDELAELTAPDQTSPPPTSSAPALIASSTSSRSTPPPIRRSSAAAAAATPRSKRRSRRAASSGWTRSSTPSPLGGRPPATRRTPALETAVQGWFFFVEGAVLRWLEQRDIERAS